MKTKIIKGLQVAVMVILLVALIVGNVVCYLFRSVITTYFGGYGFSTASLEYDNGRAVCEEIEEEGIVLLKNKNEKGEAVLPLVKGSEQNKTKINVFGWSSIDFCYNGWGSGGTTANQIPETFLDNLEKAGFAVNSDLIGLYRDFKQERDINDTLDRGGNSPWSSSVPYLNLIEPDVGYLTSRVSMASAKEFSSTAIMVITRLGGEHQDIPKSQPKWNKATNNWTWTTDRTYLDISTEEEQTLRAIKDAGFEKTIVIVNSTNTMNLGFVDDPALGIDAVLQVGVVGQTGTRAVASVLNGDVTPSGKTADTFVYDFSTAPSYANSPDGHNVNTAAGSVHTYEGTTQHYIDYQEGIYVGYKWYETADCEGFWDSAFAKAKWNLSKGYDDVVQYPFGYGLSYTQFEWNVLGWEVSRDADPVITVKVSVKNTGDRPGKEVVQLYYCPPYTKGGIEKASKNLCAFQKTTLLYPESEADGTHPNTEIVTLSFQVSDMKSYDDYDANGNGFEGYELETGAYTVYLSRSAHETADVADAEYIYRVGEPQKMREVDGAEVVNRFTGDSATDGGISADGSNSGQNITYLTRESFTTTFPVPTEARRTLNDTLKSAAEFKYNEALDMDAEPIYEDIYGNEDGSLNLLQTVKDENGEDRLVYNIELIDRLAKNTSSYDDPLWDDVLAVMTLDELITLITRAGYKTEEIGSIDKPLVIDLDGPMGINVANMTKGDRPDQVFTFFPSEGVLAQTWSDRLAYLYGMAIGYEASAGVGGWYAPGINIHRTPFGGRNFEYFSEDGYLSGMLAAYVIDAATSNGLACYMKHFAVNETGNNGHGASANMFTWLTEQAMREVYLKGFEIAVKKGGANGVMAAYSDVGAMRCRGSYALLTQILRQEWGFRGAVITDAVEKTTTDWIYQGLYAGTDLWLNTTDTEAGIYYGGRLDKTNGYHIAEMQEAAHNMLFMYCNTISRWNAMQENLKENPDARYSQFAAQVSVKAADRVAANWVWLLVGVDVLVVAVIGGWCYLLFFRKKKRKANIVEADGDDDSRSGRES